MATSIQLNQNIKIQGPFWEAQARIVQFQEPDRHGQLRTIFVSQTQATIDGNSNLHLPGTMIILCRVHSVSINLGKTRSTSYLWRRSVAARPHIPEGGTIQSELDRGELSLLLVHRNPEAQTSLNKLFTDNGSLTCLAGQIKLKPLGVDANDTQRLFNDLYLEPSEATDPIFEVHGSGLTLSASAKLPWAEESVAGTFLLAKMYSTQAPEPMETSYRLQIDKNRLLLNDSNLIRQHWQTLSAFLNPRYPLNNTISNRASPNWVTLEITDPGRIPFYYWEFDFGQPVASQPPLRFGSGEFSFFLSDRLAYDPDNPPRSVANIIFNELTITNVEDYIVIEVAASKSHQTATGNWKYKAIYNDAIAQFEEDILVEDVVLAYDTLSTSRFLRTMLDEPRPDWVSGENAVPIQNGLLWGNMPLADGWFQIPFLNLTEQIYLDADLVTLPESDPANNQDNDSFFRGAVALGNSDSTTGEEAEELHADEHHWQLILADTEQITAQWKLAQNSTDSQLTWGLAEVAIQASGLNLILDGFFWVSTEKPTNENALPELNNWINGLESIPLQTVNPERDFFPAPITVRLDHLKLKTQKKKTEFVSPLQQSWAMEIQTDTETAQKLAAAKIIEAELLHKHSPLVWRHHPTLPMVQALPLTQSQTPPNHPSTSRQLFPMEPLTESNWRFGVQVGDGASNWATFLSETRPASEWLNQHDLPIVSLSLPGLIFDPTLADSTLLGGAPVPGIGYQWRYDIPVTDEIQALAQLPKVERDPSQMSPFPDDPLPIKPKPMNRDRYAGHWEFLSKLASLAALDGVESMDKNNEKTVVKNLIEPHYWPVTAVLNDDAYPGELLLGNDAGDGANQIILKGETALEGISGTYKEIDGHLQRTVSNGSDNLFYQIVAGSMAAATDGDRFRDQRGLWRSASQQEKNLVQTPISLEGRDAIPWKLTTTVSPISLQIAEEAAHWQFWIRDIPVKDGLFLRKNILSKTAQDVNDPEASSRFYNHLAGYEWRLGLENSVSIGNANPLKLFNLSFFPLTLEKISVENQLITDVEVVGRLQLPQSKVNDLEQLELSNAVRLVFKSDVENRLTLQQVNLEDGLGEWLLALLEGEPADAPRIIWQNVQLQVPGDGQAPFLQIIEPELHFYYFDTKWEVPLSAPLNFGIIPKTITAEVDLTTLIQPAELYPTKLSIILDLEEPLSEPPTSLASFETNGNPSDKANHTAVLEVALQVRSSERLSLEARFKYELGDRSGLGSLVEATLLGGLSLVDGLGKTVVTQKSLQFDWQRMGTNETYYFLPGMLVNPKASPGFLSVTFEAKKTDLPNAMIPKLELTSGFAECLIQCEWGKFLENDETEVDSPDTLEKVFSSSSGNLTLGYTVQWVPTNKAPFWQEGFLLNGMIEVTNLISWPAELNYDEPNNQLSLPAIRNNQDLSHIRHAIQILLNQHTIPAGILSQGSGNLLFDFVPGKTWQFLAIVEHRLFALQTNADLTMVKISARRSWTALQEIRFLTSRAFKQLLKAPNAVFLEPSGYFVPADLLEGYYHPTIRNAVIGAKEWSGMLLVEASAPHWICDPENADTDMIAAKDATLNPSTTLQYLPGGNQLCILSQLQDYSASSETNRLWNLFVTPFIGRLQASELDGLSEEASLEPELFQIDPFLELQRKLAAGTNPLPSLLLQMTSWGDDEPVHLKVSHFDTIGGRKFSRLDPLTLEENWFRIQNPADEFRQTQANVASIMAAFPNTPARLSRSAALQQAFDSFRAAYPPALPKEEPSAEVDLTDKIIWRPEDRRLTWQRGDPNSRHRAVPYAWQHTALLLATGKIAPPFSATSREKNVRLTACTQHPIERERNGKSNFVPVSFAISPYKGLAFKAFDSSLIAGTKLKLVSIELLSLSPGEGLLKPIASILREISKPQTAVSDDAKHKILTPEMLDTFCENWAIEMHSRMTPESSVAVMRLREIRSHLEQNIPDTLGPLQVSYRFKVVTGLKHSKPITKRVFQMRQGARLLRFREGQFGGFRMPGKAELIELAPLHTSGVQPMYLQKQFGMQWPWGFSALRVSLQVTEGMRGVYSSEIKEIIGDEPNLSYRLWWQAIQNQIQFRSAVNSDKPTAGLPEFFRAEAIKHLLPAIPNLPLPTKDRLKGEEADTLVKWQPVLPGSMHYLIIGNRAGGYFALRHQLIRQLFDGEGEEYIRTGIATNGETLVSGSVPAQHRYPRPVPLPENSEDQTIALQTWASFFEPEQNHLLTKNPADEAFYAACGDDPATRLRLELIAPQKGEIMPNWDGTIKFKYKVDEGGSDLSNWTLEPHLAEDPSIPLQLVEGQTRPLTYSLNSQQEEITIKFSNGFLPVITSDEDKLTKEPPLQSLLASLFPGQRINLNVGVFFKFQGENGKEKNSFVQTLKFPLIMKDSRNRGLPLEPRFIYFEDPEYNRLLASLSGRATKLVQELREIRLVQEDDSEPVQDQSINLEFVQGSITFATDRRDYNPTSQIAFRYDWDDGRSEPSERFFAFLRIELVTANGQTATLTHTDEKLLFTESLLKDSDSLEAERTIKNEEGEIIKYPFGKLKPANLYQFSIGDLIHTGDADRREFDTLGSKLKFTLVQYVRISDNKEKKVELIHTVDLVEAPVIPVPEAGYALLRSENDEPSVSCRRFAWSPNASRIELICDQDLRQEIVRRRAIFRWNDTIRRGVSPRYAIQKYTVTGSTHFPDIIDFELN